MVRQLRVAIIYASFSGNTKEVAEMVEGELVNQGHSAELWRIGVATPSDLSVYDLVIIGSFTWGEGETPELVKRWVYDLPEKPSQVAVFGTGDTQFPDYCVAADRLARYFASVVPALKIEQSPRDSQENKITEWTKGVLRNVEARQSFRTYES